jgi:hypothetical protein
LNIYIVFMGNYDGNGHQVSGLYINRPDTSAQGLFGVLEGSVRNLTVLDFDVTGYEAVAGLAGVNSGSVENCCSLGNVTGFYSVGGLVGFMNMEMDT